MVVDPAYGNGRQRDGKLSYKFQRLREQLRAAILSGEFHQRLPGERELGRRYGANAKTINKALCDLSSEGLLVRRIGRGTFVTGNGGQTSSGPVGKTFRVLIPSDQSSPLVQRIFDGLQVRLGQRGHLLDWQAINRPFDSPKPGWLGAGSGLAGGVFVYRGPTLRGANSPFGDAVLADIVRRHVPTVVIGGELAGLKFNTVSPDYSDAGFRLGEHFCQMGCRGVFGLIGSIANRESELVLQGARSAAARMKRPFQILPASTLSDWAAAQVGRRNAAGAAEFGILAIGLEALTLVRQNARIAAMAAAGSLLVGAALDVGESDAPEASNVARYEISLDRVLDWAVREMIENRVGQRPVEIIVPGVLRPGAIESSDPISQRTNRPSQNEEVADELLSEAVIS